MTILDTSLIIPLVRPGSSTYASELADQIGDLDVYLTSITQLELLQGAKDEVEWRKLENLISAQDVLQPAPIVWWQAPRTFFELRRAGFTVRSVFDCMIAEIAIARDMQLLHNDRDFEVIARIRPLVHRHIDIQV